MSKIAKIQVSYGTDGQIAAIADKINELIDAFNSMRISPNNKVQAELARMILRLNHAQFDCTKHEECEKELEALFS